MAQLGRAPDLEKTVVGQIPDRITNQTGEIMLSVCSTSASAQMIASFRHQASTKTPKNECQLMMIMMMITDDDDNDDDDSLVLT